MESESVEAMLLATEQVINNCIEEDLDLRKIPMFDIEYMLTQIRSKSIGEVVKPVTTCSSCGEQQEVNMDISQATIVGETKDDSGNTIKINDSIGVVMSYPTMDSMTRGLLRSNSNGQDSMMEDLIYTMVDNMKYIYDADEVYNCGDCKEEELVKFVDSLTKEQFYKIADFFNEIPKLSLEKSHKCSKCGAEDKVVVEGLQNFLVKPLP